MSEMIKDLKKLVPEENLAFSPEDLLAYEADATRYFARGNPEAVVLPTSVAQVSDVMKYAAKNRIPITPRGAGSGLSGGCTPICGGIVLDMKRMNHILDINKGNLSAQAECGVVLARFHSHVKKENLFYPPDPQSMAVCTLGGNVATRAGGPHGVKYGTTANYVLGLEVVLPDGEIIHTGGSCVKQSVGYDVTHLMTGSEGTLGVITKVTLRLLPLPESDRTIIISCETVEQAVETVSAIIAAGIVPAMLEYVTQGTLRLMNQYITPPMTADGKAYLLVKLDGIEAQIAEEAARLSDLCKQMKVMDIRVTEDEKEAKSIWTARSKLFAMGLMYAKRVITEDVTVPRDRIPELAAAMDQISKKTGVLIGMAGHAGDGNMHPSVFLTEISEETEKKAEAAVEEIVKAGLALGGCISGEHGIGLHKSAFLEMEMGRRQVDLFKQIKQAIDPAGIMNPGKIWKNGEGTC